jgi:multidrug efflux pump subunit AcrA (membrane-fusion protein)
VRTRLLAAGIAGVVASAGVGWAAGTRIKSPAQVAADAAPPTASRITAPVERRALSSAVTTRGTVRYGQPVEVTPAASTLKGTGQGSALVTRPPTKGATLSENAVALEVAGRPVFVLQGDRPMYRDLRPGDTGEDVRQLEAALQRLGFSPGRVDGRYDVATEAAVDAWYEASGYTAQGPTDEQRERLRSARSAVSTAEDALLRAQEAYDAAVKGPTDEDVARQAAEVRRAERELAKAREQLEEVTAGVGAAEAAEAAARAAEAQARAAVASAEVDARLTLARAGADVAAAQNRLADAHDAKRVADQRLEDDLNTYRDDDPDDDVPPQRVASDAQIEQDRAAVAGAARAITEAQTALANAELALDAARRKTDESVAQAQLAVTRAALETQSAVQATLRAVHAVTEAQRSIAAADDALALARLSLDVLRRPPDVRSATAQLAKATRDVADARSQLRELDGEIGVVVPADEVLFFPTLPLRVDEAKVDRGGNGDGAVMVVTTSRLAIDASVSIPDARSVRPGAKVTVSSSELGVEVTGTVSRIADRPGTDGVDAQRVYVEVVPDSAPPELTGASVRVRIQVRATDGEVLAVPVAAVSVGADGTSRVELGDGRKVTVETGLSADGFVEVTPVAGSLRAGDRVVVGR